MTRICLALAMIHVVSIASCASADIAIVTDGRPNAVIVTADEPSASAQKAVSVLQEYIRKISGAELAVQTESQPASGNRILVGHSDALRRLGVDVPSGHTYQLKEEGFVIRTIGNDLVLAGNEDWQYRGTEIAVNKLLESLGCRWYFPGEYGEVVPKQRTITISETNRTERPSFRLRNIWFSGWITVNPQDGQEFSKWYDLNNMSRLPNNLPGDGSIARLAPASEYFESHNHIYAIDEEGNRVRDMLCMTEPDAVKISVKTITKYFRENPDEITYGFAPPDGHPMCHGPRCVAALPGFGGKGFGDPSLSDLWFNFANNVAAEVYKEFPDRWILTNGYANRVRLPESIKEFSPNLGIQSAAIAACVQHRTGDPKCWQRVVYEQLLQRWTDELDWVFIYDYDPGKGVDGLPAGTLHCIAYDLPWLHERGAWGFWTEGNNGWMVTHLNYYVRARLMWDVNEDVKQIVRDYCENFYGNAADAIERYIWALERAVEESTVHVNWGRITPWKQILTPDVIDQLDELIADARQQDLGPAEQLHVDVMWQVHQHMKTYLDMAHAVDDGDFQKGAELAAAMLKMRDELAEINTALIPHTQPSLADFRSTTEWHRDMYQGLADRAGGKSGELIAMLPRQWEFKFDPKDMGVLYRWYLPDRGDRWDKIDVTSNWETQGHQEADGTSTWGKAWYRHTFELPASAAGKPLTLTFGAVYNRGVWVWVNGVLVAHNSTKHDVRTPLDIDVTGHLKPGEKNTVAVLVNTPMPGRNPRGGLHRRVFIWSPR